MLRGQALFDLGQREKGMAELEAGFENTRELSAKLMDPWFAGVLASVKIDNGETAEAKTLLRDAFDTVAETGTTYPLPILHCLKGEIALKEAWTARHKVNAYESFMTAASIARAHGSRAIELRATVGMVTSRRGQPEFAAAMASLENALAYFTPGEDSKDLVEALAMVREQAAASTMP
jgi:predicted ATPase